MGFAMGGFVRVRFLFLALMVMVGSVGRAEGPAGTLPEQRAAAFYTYYLQALTQHRFPLDDPGGPIRQFVAAPLLTELTRKAGSPDGLGSDYFLRVQDWPDDWPAHVVAGKSVRNGPSAATVVTLGMGAGRRSVRVTLVKEEGVWKIRRVAPGR